MDHPELKILMVCLGNICRSPTAEAVFRLKAEQTDLPLRFQVDSAGTGDWHVGNPPDNRAVQMAALRHYDLSPLRARQVKVEDFTDFDYILAMDKANLTDLTNLCPEQYRHKVSLLLSHSNSPYVEVPDPYHSGTEGFELVLDLVEEACEALLDKIGGAHGISSRS